MKALLKAGAEVIVLAKTEESLKAFKEEVLEHVRHYGFTILVLLSI